MTGTHHVECLCSPNQYVMRFHLFFTNTTLSIDRHIPYVHHRLYHRNSEGSQLSNQYPRRTSAQQSERSFNSKAAIYEVYASDDNGSGIHQQDGRDHIVHDVTDESVHHYSDRSQLIAFTLSCFFFGAARLYVEHYITGGIQIALLSLLLLLICITCVLSFAPHDFMERVGITQIEALQPNPNDEYTPTGWLRQCMLISIFWVPLALIICFWWIHDIACFGLNDITDGRGLLLYPDLWG